MAGSPCQDRWGQRKERLEAIIKANPCQRQNDPAQSDKILDPQLYSVAKNGDVDEFIRALEDHCAREGVSLPIILQRRSPAGNTLLHAAAESDDNVRAIVNFVPQSKISQKNSRGDTPLLIAARAGKTDVVKRLLPNGKPRCTDCGGNSALHEAVRNRHYEVIRQLVREDPYPLYRQNKESKSPWCLAVETGDLEVLSVLLEEAPKDGEEQRRSESETVFGMSPVRVAINYRRKDMLTMMWEKKPWLFQSGDVGGGTPLHVAAYTNYLDGVKFLIEKFPTSAREQDSKDGYLPIHVACMMNHVRIVRELLQQWPDPAEFTTRQGQNILHVSARHGSVATIAYILLSPKFGHLINASDFDGNTPLHLAALHCQPSVVLLARHGRVDLNTVNMNHMTALDVVEQDMKVVDGLLRERLTWTIMASAGKRASGEVAICKPIGWSSWKQKDPEDFHRFKDKANSCMVVAALMAFVTFTYGLFVPGEYDNSDLDVGIPISLHKALYNVFVISNSMAMYSSIMAVAILLWTQINDLYVVGVALFLSDLPLSASYAAMPLVFVAGIYVTVTKLAWLSTFILVLGYSALNFTSNIFMLRPLPLGSRLPLINCFTDPLIFWVLLRVREETAGSGTAEHDVGYSDSFGIMKFIPISIEIMTVMQAVICDYVCNGFEKICNGLARS